jgi:hypothetical protein
MKQNLSEEDLIRNYILGQLPEDQQNVLEVQMLTDPEFFETSLMIESELLDDYVVGSLSEHDRMRLESRLLMSSQQQFSVKLTRLLRSKSNTPTVAEKPLTNPFSRLKRCFRWHKSNLALVPLGPVA